MGEGARRRAGVEPEEPVGRRTAGRVAMGEESVGTRWCEGYGLLDPLEQRLGRVERVFCNRAGDPQYVRVRTGVLGRRLVLIPVLDVVMDAERRQVTLR